jgi:hypothetical protein
MGAIMAKGDLQRAAVRLPPDIKQWLEVQTIRNASSQNSEIVRSIRERMDRDAWREVSNGT